MKSNHKGGDVAAAIEKRPSPTLARLHELLNFEPGVGLCWKIQRGRARRGDVAGGRHHSGNRRIGIDRRSYRLDQIVRLYGADLKTRTGTFCGQSVRHTGNADCLIIEESDRTAAGSPAPSPATN